MFHFKVFGTNQALVANVLREDGIIKEIGPVGLLISSKNWKEATNCGKLWETLPVSNFVKIK